MSRVPSLSSPFLLGFDEIERVLDRVSKAADGYPPYNIERILRDEVPGDFIDEMHARGMTVVVMIGKASHVI
jgi:hypothetical protein